MEDIHSKNLKKSICHLCLGVFQKQEPNIIIGWCGLDGEAEIGKTVLFYMIDEKYRNRGYATQCAMELINYAFEKMEYDIFKFQKVNGVQVLKYSLSPIFFSNKKYMVLAPCNKDDKEKIRVGFVTH